MISNYKSPILQMSTVLKLKYKNVIKMKKRKKPDLDLLRTSYLSNEIKKKTAKSHETIPLNTFMPEQNLPIVRSVR
jgi:hypothetical protein